VLQQILQVLFSVPLHMWCIAGDAHCVCALACACLCCSVLAAHLMRCGGQQRRIWQVELRWRSSVAALCCRWLQEEELVLLGRLRRCPRLARCLVASVCLRCACLVLCGGLHCASALCFSCVWSVSVAPFWRALGMDWCEAWWVPVFILVFAGPFLLDRV
jgi:hypothetical protein